MRAALAVLAALAGPAAADVWQVRLGPLRAAELLLDGTETGGDYRVVAQLHTTGLVRLAARVSYVAEVAGALGAAGLRPARYREAADTGRRQSQAALVWERARLARIELVESGAAAGERPQPEAGSVDPLTALWTVARPRPAAGACDLTLALFDGRRVSRLWLGPAEPAPEGLLCRGEYRRLAGFTAEDMAERAAFPLAAVYRVEAGQAVLERVELDTLFGRARIERR